MDKISLIGDQIHKITVQHTNWEESYSIGQHVKDDKRVVIGSVSFITRQQVQNTTRYTVYWEGAGTGFSSILKEFDNHTVSVSYVKNILL
jgi:hypothetical protein